MLWAIVAIVVSIAALGVAAYFYRWVKALPTANSEVDRIGARMAFASCHLKVGERKILRASGVFAIVKPVEPPPGGHVHGRLHGPGSDAHVATPPTAPNA